MSNVRRQTDRLGFLLFENIRQTLLSQRNRRETTASFIARAESPAPEKSISWRAPADFFELPSFISGHRPLSRPPASDATARDERDVLLVVEDDPDDYLLLERALRKAGAVTALQWAQTGAEALASLDHLGSRASVVCVVADVQLPRMDGFELLRHVRSRSRPACIRFAFLTGCRDPLTLDRARKSSADAFFVKPNGVTELTEIARAIARLAQARAG